MKIKPSTMSSKEISARIEALNDIQAVLFAVAIIAGLFGISSTAKAECSEIYLKVGAGYKFHETEYFTYYTTGERIEIQDRSPISARFESGVECGKVTFGVSHDSQWETGAPFNNKEEIHKSEIFIDYTFSWGL